jgi:hypothetical protein
LVLLKQRAMCVSIEFYCGTKLYVNDCALWPVYCIIKFFVFYGSACAFCGAHNRAKMVVFVIPAIIALSPAIDTWESGLPVNGCLKHVLFSGNTLNVQLSYCFTSSTLISSNKPAKKCLNEKFITYTPATPLLPIPNI